MSLVNLTTETMVVQSERLLDPKKLKKTLTALPLIQMLVPVLQQAHDDLHAKQRLGSTSAKQIQKLREESLERDTRHDRKLRGTYNYLTALAELTDDPEEAAALLDLRDRLAPKGLFAITRSYTDEAGDAKMLPSRLDPASKKLLGKLQTPDGPLQVHVDAWVEEATQLGVLEERREQLEKEIRDGGGGPTAAAVVAARHAWIRAVRAIETNLALVPGVTPETVDAILGPLRRAEMKADRRKGTAKGKPTGTTEGTPEGETSTPDLEDAKGNAAANEDATEGADVQDAETSEAKAPVEGPEGQPQDAAKPEKAAEEPAAKTEKPVAKAKKPAAKAKKPAAKPAKPS